MNPREQQLFDVLDEVWTSFLGLGVRRRAVEELPRMDAAFTIAYVGVRGAWQGEVVLGCAPDLARYVAAQLYAITPEMVGDAEIRDTLSEVGNIVAGHVKGLLPGPSSLKVPLVGYGDSLRVRLRLPDQPTSTSVLADCYGWPVVLALSRHW